MAGPLKKIALVTGTNNRALGEEAAATRKLSRHRSRNSSDTPIVAKCFTREHRKCVEWTRIADQGQRSCMDPSGNSFCGVRPQACRVHPQ
jgi:hypothetical protein